MAGALAEGEQALRRQAARHACDRCDAEDALQDACAQFMRSYQGSPGADALRYLMVAVKHRAWALRATARARAVSVDPTDAAWGTLAVAEGPGPAELAIRSEESAAMAGALDALKPDERAALVLVGLGYSYRDIAARQGWSATKVNRCVYEGRAAARALMGGREPA